MPNTMQDRMTESLDSALAMFDAEVMASIEESKPTSQIASELNVPVSMVVESLARLYDERLIEITCLV